MLKLFGTGGNQPMIAFEVRLNGEKLCLASVGEYGVLSHILSWSDSKRNASDDERERRQPHFSIGGLVDDEHVRWIRLQYLDVGDEITVKILDVESADEPIHRETAESKAERAAKIEAAFEATLEQLPSTLVEGEFLSSRRGYDELRAADEPKMAVKTLANLGDLNNLPPEFWAELQCVAGHLRMYRQIGGYRKKANLDEDENAEDAD